MTVRGDGDRSAGDFDVTGGGVTSGVSSKRRLLNEGEGRLFEFDLYRAFHSNVSVRKARYSGGNFGSRTSDA